MKHTRSTHSQPFARRTQALLHPIYSLTVIETVKHPLVIDGQEEGHYLTEEPLKKIPLMKGIDRNTARRSCDMMQAEYDRECKPVRVYLYAGNDPCPKYAGLAGACK